MILPRASSIVRSRSHSCELSALIYFKYTNFSLQRGCCRPLFGSGGAIAGGYRATARNFVLHVQGIAYLFDVAAGEEPLESLGDFLLFKQCGLS